VGSRKKGGPASFDVHAWVGGRPPPLPCLAEREAPQGAWLPPSLGGPPPPLGGGRGGPQPHGGWPRAAIPSLAWQVLRGPSLAGGPAASMWGWSKGSTRLPPYPCHGFGGAVPKPVVGLPHRESFFHTLGSVSWKKGGGVLPRALFR
jgi:hypothetical protein